jgi:hypothetical protein
VSGAGPTADQKSRKRPFGRRVGERARSLGVLSQQLVSQPSSLPGKARGWFRQWFRKVWSVRGGGLYACGFAVAFPILEVREIIDDIAGFSSIGDFFSGHLLEYVIRFAVDSLINTAYALMWPAFIVQVAPPYGAISLVLAIIVFPRYLKKPIERWLFAADVEPPYSA